MATSARTCYRKSTWRFGRVSIDSTERARFAEVGVASSVFDAFVGRHALAPNSIINISRDGDHFYLQATAQPKFEMFASSPREFFLKVADAHITFEVDDRGRATALVLHQNGQDQRAKRVE